MRTGLAMLFACAVVTTAVAQAPEKEKFELVSLSRKINTPFHDSAPVVSPDGKTLYFTVNDHPENTRGKGSQDIWYSEVDPATGDWSQAKHMPAPLNTNQYNQVLSVSPDGNTLLVRGGAGKDALGFSLCKRLNDKWQKPEPLKIEGFDKMCKGRFNGAFLALDASALLLYFSETEGAKYSDLYVSFPKGSSWTRPQLITALNTRQDEFGPFIAPDNKTLYFASNRPGGFGNADIYKTTRQDNSWLNWSKPENIGAPINTGGFDAYYSIGNSDTLVFTTRAYMSADGGHLDIQTLRRVREKKVKIMLAGKVVDQKTGEPIAGANVRILKETEVVGASLTEGKDHEFKAQLPGPGIYSLQINAEGYLAGTDTLDVAPVKADLNLYRTIYLKKLEVGLSVRLNNIFFDFDKTTLRSESFPELDKVVELMEQNPGLYIEIGGHTDDKGSDEYNEKLSQGRAEAVRQYLLEKWIEPARITARGYGESKPEVANDTDENRQINRRVEFTILQNSAKR